MSDQPQYGFLQPPDAKRRKLEGDIQELSLQGRSDRTKGSVDKAKANYLSGQLRLRLQYAKLKVEHGWQRQSLSEVENLYFRHTHLTRPYPVISPGGRRNGRTLSSNSLSSAAPQQTSMSNMLSGPSGEHSGSIVAPNAASGLRSYGSLVSTPSSSSLDTCVNTSIPSTPTIDAGRTVTPHAPHIGFGNAVTRYPISRSDSTATVIIESASPLPHVQHAKDESSHVQHPHTLTAPSSRPDSQSSPVGNASFSFREPFDPMEPTEHIDSQLAALRSMMSTSSMAVPVPPPPPTSSPSATTPAQNNGANSGLTYDAFWSSHSSATSSYRALLASQGGSQTRSAVPLQGYASAPPAFAPASTGTAVGNGSASAQS